MTCKTAWAVGASRHGFIYLLRIQPDYKILFYGCESLRYWVETHKLPGFYNLITHRNKDICWVAKHLMEDLENCKRTCRPKVNGGSKSRDKWTIREYFLKETLVLSQQISEPFAKVLRLFFKSLDCLDDVLTPHCRHSGIFIDEWQVCVLLVFPSTTLI